MNDTDTGTYTRILIAVLGFWFLMRAINRDATGRTLVDRILNQKGGANQTAATATSSPLSGAASTTTTTGGTVAAPPGGNYTQTSWAQAMLTTLGISPTPLAVSKVVAWETQEGGNWNNSAKFNPLNTTQHEPGSAVMGGGSSAGVQAYNSWQQGLQATLDTLHNGLYGGILQALSDNYSLPQFKTAVNSSPWGTVF